MRISQPRSLLDEFLHVWFTVTPILYTFRRCPYCIRAHMALCYAGVKLRLREVKLGALPPGALAVSPCATVPALVVSDELAMTESWDIVKWALAGNDPDNWLGDDRKYQQQAERLVACCDGMFKQELDRYKYAVRHQQHPASYYRQRAETFLHELEGMLGAHDYLFTDRICIADVAVFPFIRQFAMVDKAWFDAAPYPGVQRWLAAMLTTPWFAAAFSKRAVWTEAGEDSVV